MKLGTLFSDGMVLQAGQVITVWGETLPGLLIEAAIAEKTSYAKASNDGFFLIHLPSLPPGGPYELKVSAVENKAERITVKDVLIGEVWLCSGQSNMEYPLGADWASAGKNIDSVLSVSRKQEKELIKTVKEPVKFRFITVPRMATGCREKYFEGQWHYMDEAHAPEASAVAAWFGFFLRQELKVPVGLICCSWGGTIAEAWTSPATLRTCPITRMQPEIWNEIRRKKETWLTKPTDDAVTMFRQCTHTDPGNTGVTRGWADPDFDDSSWKPMNLPGSWINQGVAGNGAVWVRKQVDLPADLAGKDLILNLGGIDKHDITYFNGVEIGRTGKDFEQQFYMYPRQYAVPGSLVKAGANTIAIRAFSFIYNGGFDGIPEAYSLTAPDRKIPLAGSWKACAEIDWGRIKPLPLMGVYCPNTPGILFDSMIRPLLPYGLRGIIWYQGESNAKNTVASAEYRSLLENMIRDWRFHFEQPELPFIQVQLADFRIPKDYDPSSVWAVLRESQRKVCDILPNTYLATALDTGETNDIHPQNKKDVGLRLAASALHYVYGQENTLPSGPVFWKTVCEGNSLRVFFHFTEGLELRGNSGSSFYIAGSDRHYFPVDRAEISGDSILLTSSQVNHPVFVRYAWADNPNNILYNQRFPAASFDSENQ